MSFGKLNTIPLDIAYIYRFIQIQTLTNCWKVINFSTPEEIFDTCYRKKSKCFDMLKEPYCYLFEVDFTFISHLCFFHIQPCISWISELADIQTVLKQPWKKSEICKKYFSICSIYLIFSRFWLYYVLILRMMWKINGNKGHRSRYWPKIIYTDSWDFLTLLIPIIRYEYHTNWYWFSGRYWSTNTDTKFTDYQSKPILAYIGIIHKNSKSIKPVVWKGSFGH